MSKFIAHRGLSRQYLENTLQAFDGAWKADCAGIELDIQVSKDQQVLVIHDPDTARLSDENFSIADTDWSKLQNVVLHHSNSPAEMVEIAEIDAMKEYRISKLQDVLSKVPTGKVVQIEIKHHIDNDAGMNAVLDDLESVRNDISIQIISFDASKLAKVKQAYPHLCCLYLLPEDLILEQGLSKHGSSEQNLSEQCIDIDGSCKFAMSHSFDGVGLRHELITEQAVNVIKSHSLLIDVWTVNDVDSAKRMLDLGVDFIASDIADEMNTFFKKETDER